MTPKLDKFVRFAWECRKCRQAGTVRVYHRDGQTVEELEREHQGNTRRKCLVECAYHVTDTLKESA